MGSKKVEKAPAYKKEDLVDFAVTARKYKTLLTKKFMNRKIYEEPNPYEIRAYIPGTALKLFVKEGQEVKEGETIMILEAMKMQNQIKMPYDGIIKEIRVEAGQKVRKDDLMILLAEIE
jgi:biotin carboxyl carrier protein